MRRCQYCGRPATHGHTPAGENYAMYLCQHHYWKVIDLNGEEE